MCAVLTYFMQPGVFAIVAAVASAITSWSEFSDLGSKVQRSSKSVQALLNLHTWWCSLTAAEQASTANITQLVNTCEDIITTEQRDWSMTAARCARSAAGSRSSAGSSSQAKGH